MDQKYVELDEKDDKVVIDIAREREDEEVEHRVNRTNKAIRLALGATEWNRSVIVMKGDFKAIDMRDVDSFEDSPSDTESKTQTRKKPESWYRQEWREKCTEEEQKILDDLKVEYDRLLTKLTTKSITKFLSRTELVLTREIQSEMFAKSVTMLRDDLVKGFEYSKRYPKRRFNGGTAYFLCVGSYELVKVILILSAVVLYCKVFYYLMFQWQT